MDGPRLLVDRRCLSPLALILHEWATNSVKYGALASDRGVLAISWLLYDGQIQLEWSETGGSTADAEPAKGFGTLLVQTSSRQLGASLERDASQGRYLLRLVLPDTVLSHD